MGSSLSLITNTSLKHVPAKKDWERIVSELKTLNLERSWTKHYGSTEQDKGEWQYKIHEPNIDLQGLYIAFYGPLNFEINMYDHITEIDTINRYYHLYEFYGSVYFKNFRRNLYQILKIIGGTEVIYLSDSSVDKLPLYQEMALFEGQSYDKVKANMIKDLGEPVRDYALLDVNSLDYNNISEFFLDDFKDLKK